MQSVIETVFLSDADKSFNATISSDIWKGIGAALGFSAAAVAATMPAAVTGAAPAPPSLPPGSVVAGAQGPKMLSMLLVVGTGVAAITAATVFMKPAGRDGAYPPFPEDAAPVVEIVQEAPSVEELIGEDPISPPAAREDQPAGGKTTILIEHETLRYNIGESPAPEQIVRDANARGFDQDGGEIELAVLEYDQINFNVPDEYYVYLETTGEEIIRRVVIISIE